MGLDNRDYARDNETGFQLRAPQSMVGALILASAILNIVDIMSEGKLSGIFALDTDVVRKPWMFWQVATYGFMHSTSTLLHLVFNMIGLWIFGSEMEGIYGRREFLRIYLGAIVFGGLAWLGFDLLTTGGRGYLVGASAAVMCMTLLFALHYPQRIILAMGLIPVKAWLLCTIYISLDILGALGAAGRSAGGHATESTTAFVAHLGGAAFGFVYYRFGWNFGRMLPESFDLQSLKRMFRRSPKLKLHEPTGEPPPPSLDAEVDRILAKINVSGFDSLSAEERKTLERASARYQKRRQ